MLFADRIQRRLYNAGVLTPEKLKERYSQIADNVERAIVAESARWGDQHFSTPLTLQEWYNEKDWILNTYLPARSDIVLDQLQTAGLHASVEAPAFHINNEYQHGGDISSGDALAIIHSLSADQTPSNDLGDNSAWFTTDGGDPRLPGGLVNPLAQVYVEPIILDRSVHIKARVLKNDKWSALNEAVFAVGNLSE